MAALTSRVGVLVCLLCALSVCQSRSHLRSTGNSRARIRVAEHIQSGVKSTVSVGFVLTGGQKLLDDAVKAMLPNAQAAHPVIDVIAPRMIGKTVTVANGARKASTIPIVYLEVEKGSTGMVKAGTAERGKTPVPVGDDVWAEFAGKSTMGCDQGDFDVFVVMHYRAATANNDLVQAALGMYAPLIDQSWFWTNFVKNVDKRTKRIVMIMCFGSATYTGFKTAVDAFNRGKPTPWNPIFVGNKQPMSLTDGGALRSMKNANVAKLASGKPVSITDIAGQVESIKDMEAKQNGAAVSLFPNVPLASVQAFQQCKGSDDSAAIKEDLEFALRVMSNPSSVTTADVTGATTCCSAKTGCK